MAGDEQEDDGGDELVLFQAVAVLFGPDQVGQQVILRAGSTSPDVGPQVSRQVDDGIVGRRQRRPRDQRRGVDPDRQGLAVALDQRVVLAREPDQLTDDPGGQRVRQLGHEVELGPAPQRREHLLGELGDPPFKVRDAARGEGSAHQGPQPRVIGRVTEQEEVADHVEERARRGDAAAATFAERGFHGTTVGHVVARAGFTRGAFYSNFSDLDDLFLAVFDDRMAVEEAEIAPLVAGAASMEELVDLIRGLRPATRSDAGWRLLMAEFRLHAQRDAKVRPRLAERKRALRRSYRIAVEHVFAVAGVEPPADPDLMALIVQVLVDGIGYQQDVDPDGVGPDAFLDSISLLFEAAVALARTRGDAGPA